MLPIDIFSVYFNGDLIGVFLDDSYSLSNDNLHNAIKRIFANMGFRSLNDYTKHLPSYKSSGQKFLEYRDEKSNYHRYVNHKNKKTHEVTFDFLLLYHHSYWGSTRALSITTQIKDLFKKQSNSLRKNLNYRGLSCPFLISPTLQDFADSEWAEDDDINLLWFCKDWSENCSIKSLEPTDLEISDKEEIAKAIRVIQERLIKKHLLHKRPNSKDITTIEELENAEIDDMMDDVFGP